MHFYNDSHRARADMVNERQKSSGAEKGNEVTPHGMHYESV